MNVYSETINQTLMYASLVMQTKTSIDEKKQVLNQVNGILCDIANQMRRDYPEGGPYDKVLMPTLTKLMNIK